jgi:hypothetical protein
MNKESKNNDLTTSKSEGVSKGIVVVLASALSLLVYVPLYLARDKLPDWVILFLDPRLVISGVLLIGLGVYICARVIRKLFN